MKLGELYFEIAVNTQQFSASLEQARQRATSAA
jgi:hypothetical protein